MKKKILSSLIFVSCLFSMNILFAQTGTLLNSSISFAEISTQQLQQCGIPTANPFSIPAAQLGREPLTCNQIKNLFKNSDSSCPNYEYMCHGQCVSYRNPCPQ